LAEGSADAALRVALAPGNYTAVLSDASGRGGAGLVEIYEADQTTDRLVNLSTRSFVGPEASVAIAGLVVRGEKPARYLVRAVGPGLAGFGVGGVLNDPVLMLTTAAGATMATNDNWGTAATAGEIGAVTARVGGFPLAANSRDAALLVTLAPGSFTALVSGAGGTSGVVLVEVFEVP
jgi:hypothetical protein